MKTIACTFDRAWPGHPLNLSEGETISADITDGFSLCRLVGDSWQSVAIPFTADADCLVRYDCVTYTSPVTATLTIGGGE